jgi:hypothetical protein
VYNHYIELLDIALQPGDKLSGIPINSLTRAEDRDRKRERTDKWLGWVIEGNKVHLVTGAAGDTSKLPHAFSGTANLKVN